MGGAHFFDLCWVLFCWRGLEWVRWYGGDGGVDYGLIAEEIPGR